MERTPGVRTVEVAKRILWWCILQAVGARIAVAETRTAAVHIAAVCIVEAVVLWRSPVVGRESLNLSSRRFRARIPWRSASDRGSRCGTLRR